MAGREIPKIPTKSPNLVYNDEYGERNPRIHPDTATGLNRALDAIQGADSNASRLDGGTGHDGGGDGRTSAKKFFSWAERENAVLNPEAFDAWERAHKVIGGGSEHTVHGDKSTQRVVKVTHPDLVGDGAVGQSANVGDYLTSHALANRLFSGGDIRLEGVAQKDGKFPQLVISQRFFKGRMATEPEKEAAFGQLGFKLERDGMFYDPVHKVRIADHAGDNVLAREGKDGVQVAPVDVQVTAENPRALLASDWMRDQTEAG